MTVTVESLAQFMLTNAASDFLSESKDYTTAKINSVISIHTITVTRSVASVADWDDIITHLCVFTIHDWMVRDEIVKYNPAYGVNYTNAMEQIKNEQVTVRWT